MAPLRSYISHLFETVKTKRKVSFWYGARSLSELYYDDYFKELAQKHSNFSFHVALSEPLKIDDWDSHTGFIHEILQKEYLETISDAHKKEYYLCGPPTMIQTLQRTLLKNNVPGEMISFDEF